MYRYYSPHERLTNILSTYLEFDSQQLELGLWSGDLQIKDGVNLRPNAFAPMLEAFDLRLFSGSIGKLHAQIPWKTLLEGSKLSVHLADVNIVLCFQPKKFEPPPSFGDSEEWSDENDLPDSKRPAKNPRQKSFEKEIKQKHVDDAENRLYRGAENITLQQLIEMQKNRKKQLKLGFLKELVEKVTSSLAWRLASGLHVKIERLRVTIMQDGIAFGISIDLFNVAKGAVEESLCRPFSISLQDDSKDLLQEQYRRDTNESTVEETFFRSSSQSLSKRIDIKKLGIFLVDIRRQWEENEANVGRQLQDDYNRYRRQRLLDNLFPEEDDYLVLPTGFTLNLSLGFPDKDSSIPAGSKVDVPNLPRVAFTFGLEDVVLSISRYQYRCFHDFILLSRHVANNRPSRSILADHRHPFHLMIDADGELCYKPRRSIRAWWRYAFRCVISELRASRGGDCHWIAEKRRREAYISAFTNCFLRKAASDGNTSGKFKDVFSELSPLEDMLTEEQIILYRAIARYRMYGESLNQSKRLQGKENVGTLSGRQPLFDSRGYDELSSTMTNEEYFDHLATSQMEFLENRLANVSETRLFDDEQDPMIMFHGHFFLPKIEFLLCETVAHQDHLVLRVAVDEIHLDAEGNSGLLERCRFCIANLAVSGETARDMVVTNKIERTPLFVELDIRISAQRNIRDEITLPIYSLASYTVELFARFGKVTSIVEERAIMGILHFLGDKGEYFCRIPFCSDHPYEGMRKMISTCMNSKDLKKLSIKLQQRVIYDVFISLDGFDLAIPIGEDNLEAVFKPSKWRISPCREIAHLYFIFESAEIRSGSFLRFDDTVRHWANDESNFSNKVFCSRRSAESNWQKEESQTLALLISQFPKDLFRHFSVVIRSFRLDCRQRDDELVCILRHPIHLGLLLSFSVLPALDGYPRVNIRLAISSLIVRLSEKRLCWLMAGVEKVQGILRVASRVSSRQASQLPTEAMPLPPRILVLAAIINDQVDFFCDAIHIAFIGEMPNLSALERELVLQESLSDFLSHLSCYKDDKISIDSAMKLCVGRLTALGLHEDTANCCVQQSRQAFLEELEMIQHIETADQQRVFEKPYFKFSNMLSKGDIVSEVVDDFDVSSNTGVLRDENILDDSLHAIEIPISNAVERVISSMLPSIDFYELSPNQELLVVEADLLHISSMSLYYDRKCTIEVVSIAIRNGNGVYFAKATNEGSCRHQAISFVSIDKDSAEDFGCGGLPSQALYSSDGHRICLRLREAHFSIFARSIDFVVHPKDVYSAIEAMLPILKLFKIQEPSEHIAETQKKYLVSGEIDACSIMFTSNELSPFIKLSLRKICAEYFPLIIESFYEKRLKASLGYFELYNITADGCHPDIISPEYRNVYQKNPDNFMVVDCLFPCDKSNKAALINVQLGNAKIVLLHRFISECKMYFLEKESHFGQVLQHSFTSLDSGKQSTIPSSLSISFLDSSFIFPRDSGSADLVAFKFSELKIKYRFSEKLWEAFANADIANADIFQEAKPPLPSCVSDSTDSESDEFFDCIDFIVPEMYARSSDSKNQPEIFVEKSGLSEFLVQARNLHLLTATGKILSDATESDELPMLTLVKMCGFVDNGSFAYCSKENSNSRSPGQQSSQQIAQSILQRKWTRLTQAPIALDIDVVFSPNVKLFLRFSSLEVTLASSQLYLLLSVWYGNLQELPKAFPFPFSRLKEAMPKKAPQDWPSYGSAEWVSYMSDDLSPASFELNIAIGILKWFYFFDREYFESFIIPPVGASTQSTSAQMFISSKEVDFKMKFTDDGLTRCCACAPYLEIQEANKETSTSSIYFRAGPRKEQSTAEKNDLFKWGLKCGRHTLTSRLPFAFQLSLFMTPDQWSSVNLGFDPVEGSLQDLLPLWGLMEYFGSYFRSPGFGHPFFKLCKKTAPLERELIDSEISCLNLDIRIWLNRMLVSVPCNSLQNAYPKLVLRSGYGAFYRYKSIGYSFSEQEFCCKDLSLAWASENVTEDFLGDAYALDQVSVILDGLRLFASYSFNNRSNHTHLSLYLPLGDEDFQDEDKLSGLEPEAVGLRPLIAKAPHVVGPMYKPSLNLGANICTLMLSRMNILQTYEILLNFAGVKSTPSGGNLQSEHQTLAVASRTLLLSAGGIRAVLCDPVLGTHLPLAVTSVQKFELQSIPAVQERPSAKLSTQTYAEFEFFMEYFCNTIKMFEPLIEPYKALCLFEASSDRGPGLIFQSECPFHCNITGASLDVLDQATRVFFDSQPGVKSEETNEKVIVNSLPSESVQVDVTASDVKDIFTESSASMSEIKVIQKVPRKILLGERVAYSLTNLTGRQIRVIKAERENCFQLSYLNHDDCMELQFDATYCAIQNLSIQDIPFASYIRGVSVSPEAVKGFGNRHHTIGIQVPGFAWIKHIMLETEVSTFQQADGPQPRFHNIVPLSPIVRSKVELDWRLSNALKLISEVSFFNGGRKMIVASPIKIVNKCTHSIVLALHHRPSEAPAFVNEIPAAIGGCNTAKHYISFLATSDNSPKATSHVVETIASDETYHVPFSFLESSLTYVGNNLGSVWICPEPKCSDSKKALSSMVQCYGSAVNASECLVGFSSKVEISSLVLESSRLYERSCAGGVQDTTEGQRISVSCPVFHKQKAVSSPPFCYVIEVKRSPFVKLEQFSENPSPFAVNEYQSSVEGFADPSRSRLIPHVKSMPDLFDSVDCGNEDFGSGTDETAAKKKKKKGHGVKTHRVHSPITYSLIIHPPLVLENILPRGGIFELMHFNRREVIWREYLQPGEIAPIYCVGLDAPLLLLLNLGYCRTPHGQGALIHDGSFTKDRVTNVNETENEETWPPPVGKAVAERSKNALGTISEVVMSPDDRALKRLAKVRSAAIGDDEEPVGNQFVTDKNGRNLVEIVQSYDNCTMAISNETTLVDSIGQQIKLGIDNQKGDGGNRLVRVYCPYWIVNTTEHALRYKQDGCPSFASGTYFSSARNGSKPVDGSHYSSSRAFVRENRSIFPGRKGALSHAGDSSELASLTSTSVPLDTLASLAFMFNFHERVRKKLSLQLTDEDSQFSSSWSPGFSLDSIGVSQVVAIPCVDGRALEISVSITVPMGNLSSYTKIVRLRPRYVLVNKLERPIRLWQDSSILHSSFGYFGESSFTFSESRNKANSYATLIGTGSGLIDRDTGISSGTLAHRSALYVTSARSSELLPFFLPDTRLERHLRFDFGSNWRLTSSIKADVPALKLYRALDASHLKHATARKTKEYVITLPPDSPSKTDFQGGELGVWFEAVYGKNEILVKDTKRGKFSYNSNLQVGDQLLRVDEVNVDTLTFEETMKLIKERLSSLAIAEQRKSTVTSHLRQKSKSVLHRKPTETQTMISGSSKKLTLTFRTFEERLRRERAKSSCESQKHNADNEHHQSLFSKGANRTDSIRSQLSPHEDAIYVDLNAADNTLFVTVKPFDIQNPPYFVENRSAIHTIYFRQRQCDGHPWTSLPPRTTHYYMWEENLKPKKLSIRVGRYKIVKCESSSGVVCAVSKSFGKNSGNDNTKLRILPKYFQPVQSEEQGAFGPTRTIKLDEIGFIETLPCPSFDGQTTAIDAEYLFCRVDTKGETRVLIVSDYSDAVGEDEEKVIERHIEILTRQIKNETSNFSRFQKLLLELNGGSLQEVIHSEKIMNNSTRKDSNDHLPSGAKSQLSSSSSADVLISNSTKSTELASQIEEIADYPDGATLSRRNQVIVEIIEAVGLNAADISGLVNPYCEIQLKNIGKATSPKFFSNAVVKRTYYCERTLLPHWYEQKFVFDVPEEATNCLRGYSIVVKVKSFGFLGLDLLLGQTDVQMYNIRDQQELVGWFPLKNNKGGSSVDQTCGSIRMRIQWIYTVPALLNYFLLLSEKRLEDFKKRKDDLQQQQKAIKGHSKVAKYSNQIRWKTISSLGMPIKSKNKSMRSAFLENSSIHKRTYLGSLDMQTMQSKRKQLLSYSKTSDLNSEFIAESNGSSFLESVNERKRLLTAELPTLSQGNWNRTSCLLPSAKKDSTEQGNRKRTRSDMSHDRAGRVSSEEISAKFLQGNAFLFGSNRKLRDSTDAPPVAIQNSGLRSSSFSSEEEMEAKNVERMRFMTATDLSFSSGSPSQRYEETPFEDEYNFKDRLQLLFERGALYHEPGQLFHCRHKASNLPPSETIITQDGTIRGLGSSLPFKSWLEVFNALKSPCCFDGNTCDVKRSASIERNTSIPKEDSNLIDKGRHILDLFRLPCTAPCSMKYRFDALAVEMTSSRNSLLARAERSLRSVMNPGGWLTIRPIMALNLPGNRSMHIKLKYGSLTRMSNAVDAQVFPTWTEDEELISSDDASVRQHGVKLESSAYPFNDEMFRYHDPDFKLYVEPLKTGGSLRLSLVGENVNSEVEVGVLHIPIEAALQCCMDVTDKSNSIFQPQTLNMNQKKKEPPSGSRNCPRGAYVRWFPLKDPKDSVSFEGDMGLSLLSPESEKSTNDEFCRFYIPCIKLAFLWEPDCYEELEAGKSTCPGSTSDNDDGEDQNSLFKRFLYADIKGLSASLIDSSRSIEILSLTLESIYVRHSVTKTKTRFSSTIAWIQIDHHSSDAREPVVVAPRATLDLQPTLVITTMKDNLRSKENIDTYEFVAFALQELDIKLDEIFLADCWIFFLECMHKLEIRKQVIAEKKLGEAQAESYIFSSMFGASSFLSKINNSASDNASMDTKKLYIEKLMLASMKFNLSYIKGSQGVSPRVDVDDFEPQLRFGNDNFNAYELDDNEEPRKCSTTGQATNAIDRNVESFRRWPANGGEGDFRSTMRYAYNLPNVISAIFPAISEAPIRLQGKIIDHVFESIGEIVASLKNYYSVEALSQVYRIIGSLEVLGNPIDVFSHFATGVKDFFYEPSKAFMLDPTNPSVVGLGVAKGTLSLVTHTASGFFGFASKMSSTGGATAAALSLDKTYMQRRAKFSDLVAKIEDNKSHHKSLKLAIAVARPFSDVMFGIFGAATGVIFEPYKGARKDGAVGFLKGAGIGIVGIVTKPLAGVLDACAHTAESISEFAKEVNILEKRYEAVCKRRISHAFGLNGSLLFFKMETARASELLRGFPILDKRGRQPMGKWSNEVVIWVEVLHMGPGVEMYLIVSTHRIASINLGREMSGQIIPMLNWHVILKGDTQVTSRLENKGHNGVLLHICQQQRYSNKSHFIKARDGKNNMMSSVVEILRFESLLKSPTEADLAKNGNPVGSRRGPIPSLRKQEKKPAVIGYAIQGDFHQRSQLLRVHNAISCLNNNFDAVVSESGLGPEWNKEGITTFGPFEFHGIEMGSRYESDRFPLPKHATSDSKKSGRYSPNMLQDSRHGGRSIPISVADSAETNFIGESLREDSRRDLGTDMALEKDRIFSEVSCQPLSQNQEMVADAKKLSGTDRPLSEGREKPVDAHISPQPYYNNETNAKSSDDNVVSLVTRPSEIRIADRGDFSQLVSMVSTIESETIITRLMNVEHLLEQLVKNQSELLSKQCHIVAPVDVVESRRTSVSNLSNDQLSMGPKDGAFDREKEEELLREFQAIRAQCMEHPFMAPNTTTPGSNVELPGDASYGLHLSIKDTTPIDQHVKSDEFSQQEPQDRTFFSRHESAVHAPKSPTSNIEGSHEAPVNSAVVSPEDVEESKKPKPSSSITRKGRISFGKFKEKWSKKQDKL